VKVKLVLAITPAATLGIFFQRLALRSEASA